MKTVAIFGVGLIGGSMGLALKKAGFQGRVVGVSSPATIKTAREMGAIDEALPAADAAAAADLIYLAQPITQILEILPQLNAWVQPEALVTDAGSTKGAIVQRASETLTRCTFLGGHPLAGKESRGVRHADADLFQDKWYIVTPRYNSDLEHPICVEFFRYLEKIGARPLMTDAAHHDHVVAYVSHLPQLASTALGACLSKEFSGAAPPFWGPALVDSTRLALSAYDIWGDILVTNPTKIEAALDAYIIQLQRMRDLLKVQELKQVFERAAEVASKVRNSA